MVLRIAFLFHSLIIISKWIAWDIVISSVQSRPHDASPYVAVAMNEDHAVNRGFDRKTKQYANLVAENSQSSCPSTAPSSSEPSSWKPSSSSPSSSIPSSTSPSSSTLSSSSPTSSIPSTAKSSSSYTSSTIHSSSYPSSNLPSSTFPSSSKPSSSRHSSSSPSSSNPSAEPTRQSTAEKSMCVSSYRWQWSCELSLFLIPPSRRYVTR